MIRKLLGVVALAFAQQPVPLLAQENSPAALTATGDWVVDFADNHCSVRRAFAGDRQNAVLEFRSHGLGPQVDVRLISDTNGVRQRPPVTSFLPLIEARTASTYSTLDGNGGWRGVAYRDTLPQDGANVTAYRVRDAFESDMDLATGALAGVMQVLRSCEDDLLTSLGLDPVAHRTLSRPIELRGTERWLGVTSAAQRDMLLKGSASQSVRLLVDETGKVFGCAVIEGGVDPALSDRMCAALQGRARFDPALDSAGRPIRSMYILMLASTSGR